MARATAAGCGAKATGCADRGGWCSVRRDGVHCYRSLSSRWLPRGAGEGIYAVTAAAVTWCDTPSPKACRLRLLCQLSYRLCGNGIKVKYQAAGITHVAKCLWPDPTNLTHNLRTDEGKTCTTSLHAHVHAVTRRTNRNQQVVSDTNSNKPFKSTAGVHRTFIKPFNLSHTIPVVAPESCKP